VYLRETIHFGDVFVLALIIIMIVVTIWFIKGASVPFEERYAYYGEVITEETNVDKVDTITHECTHYDFYVTYKTPDGKTFVHKVKGDQDYVIKNDGKSYIYMRMTDLDAGHYILYWLLVLVVEVFLFVCIYTDDDACDSSPLRVFRVLFRKKAPQIKMQKNNNNTTII